MHKNKKQIQCHSREGQTPAIKIQSSVIPAKAGMTKHPIFTLNKQQHLI